MAQLSGTWSTISAGTRAYIDHRCLGALPRVHVPARLDNNRHNQGQNKSSKASSAKAAEADQKQKNAGSAYHCPGKPPPSPCRLARPQFALRKTRPSESWWRCAGLPGLPPRPLLSRSSEPAAAAGSPSRSCQSASPARPLPPSRARKPFTPYSLASRQTTHHAIMPP
jgi:hypothetical protein